MSDTETLEAPLSTTLETEAAPAASGAGTPSLTVEPDKPVSVREDIEAAFKEEAAKQDEPEKPAKEEQAKEEDAADDKADDKPEAKVAEPKEDEKPAEEPKAEPKPEDRPEDKHAKHVEPPKNFLPDSREVWRNVPRAVRRDIETMTKEHEAELSQTREAVERYEALKPFDELAKSNGLDLRESLQRVHQLENLVMTNPIAGLNRILMEAGPRKADGQPFSLFEVADFIVKQGPQGYQQMMAQPQPANDRGDEAERLRAENEALRAQMQMQPIIERFALRNDRFYELQNDVALFLKSDKIPASLGPEDRLAAAYDMAVRINPPSMSTKSATSTEGQDADRRADDSFSGSKSIKQSPGSVTEEVEDEAPRGESVRDSLRKAARSIRA